MKKRMLAGFLCLCLFILSVQAFAAAEALEQDLYEDWIWEPVVEKDDVLSTGQVTEWACISFGSYPQTEIVSSSFTAVDDYALQEGIIWKIPFCIKSWPTLTGTAMKPSSTASVIFA